MGVHIRILNGHACHRQVIRSVVRRRKDSRVAIVTVTNVTNDLVEDDDCASVERLTVG